MHYCFDLWVERWRRQEARGDMIVVRYADDLAIGFEYKEDAQRFLDAMRDRLGEFALSLHPAKTRLLEFGRFATTDRKRRGMCCDGKDALHLSDVDWERQNKKDSHIRVRVPKDEEFFKRALAGEQNIETVWVDVNDNAVIDDIPNKTGVPLVWPAYYADINIIWIRCFMPGAGA